MYEILQRCMNLHFCINGLFSNSSVTFFKELGITKKKRKYRDCDRILGLVMKGESTNKIFNNGIEMEMGGVLGSQTRDIEGKSMSKDKIPPLYPAR